MKMPPSGPTAEGEKGSIVSELIPFTYEDTEVRAVTVDSEPWIVATDVARVLGYASAKDMTRMLDSDERGRHSVPTLGGEQDMLIISEAGLYSITLRSKSPKANPFRRWVTHEVIPAIRRHGGYLTPAMTEQVLSDPDTIIRLATDLKEERAKRLALEARAVESAPKVLFADAVATSHTSILVGDLAKILKGNGVDLGANRLFKVLRANGYLIRREGSDWNMPTQRSMELGLFEIKETAITHSDGHVTVNKTPKVTGKGQAYFVNRFLNGQINTEEEAA